jgi:hypothetical protein
MNDKYYSIANFFDYASHGLSNSHQKMAVSHSAHLGVDKRFLGVDGIAVGTVFYQPLVSLREIDRQYGILLQVYSSTDLLSNALRGPPSA